MLKKIFSPARDISAYELAIILSTIVRPDMTFKPLLKEVIQFSEDKWADLAPELRRHFIDETSEKAPE